VSGHLYHAQDVWKARTPWTKWKHARTLINTATRKVPVLCGTFRCHYFICTTDWDTRKPFNTSCKRRRWAIRLIRKPWLLARDQWEHRNGFVHGQPSIAIPAQARQAAIVSRIAAVLAFCLPATPFTPITPQCWPTRAKRLLSWCRASTQAVWATQCCCFLPRATLHAALTAPLAGQDIYGHLRILDFNTVDTPALHLIMYFRF
jgi:hypothetical protein